MVVVGVVWEDESWSGLGWFCVCWCFGVVFFVVWWWFGVAFFVVLLGDCEFVEFCVVVIVVVCLVEFQYCVDFIFLCVFSMSVLFFSLCLVFRSLMICLWSVG